MNAKFFVTLALALVFLAGGSAIGFDYCYADGGGPRSYGGPNRLTLPPIGRTQASPAPSIAAARPFGNAPTMYAFAAHPGWSHDRAYFLNGRYYRWYYDGWYLIDPQR